MHWFHLGPGHCVLELDYRASNEVGKGEVPAGGDLELHIYWDGGEPTRAVWLWAATRQMVGWVHVGQA